MLLPVCFAPECSANIHAYDIPFLEYFLFIGNAVHDFFVDGSADSAGKVSVTFKSGQGAAITNCLLSKLIQLPGGYPWCHHFGSCSRHLPGKPAGFRNQFDVGFFCENHLLFEAANF